jgi:tripartite-type tricarboxylate transporter receptor subunit TctC
MEELGVAGFPTEVWFGLLAPAGTPPDVVAAVNAAVNDSLKSGDARTSLAELGMDAKLGSPQDFAVALADQAREWKGVIEATEVKGD